MSPLVRRYSGAIFVFCGRGGLAEGGYVRTFMT
jgi:hypothetical protein